MYVMLEVIGCLANCGWWWTVFNIELTCVLSFFSPPSHYLPDARSRKNLKHNYDFLVQTGETRCCRTEFLPACAKPAWIYLVLLWLHCKFELCWYFRKFGCIVGSFHWCNICRVILFFLTDWLWDQSFSSSSGGIVFPLVFGSVSIYVEPGEKIVLVSQ